MVLKRQTQELTTTEYIFAVGATITTIATVAVLYAVALFLIRLRGVAKHVQKTNGSN
jgi:hypothetical protein